MNLFELQTELRNIEMQISNLESEIEKIKPKAPEEQEKDFNLINKIAENYPYEIASIKTAPELFKKLFIAVLSNLMMVDKDDCYDRLVYLTRLSVGSKLNYNAEEIVRLGLDLKEEDLTLFFNEFSEYKNVFFVEALILANISKGGAEEILKKITDMACIMKFSKEDVRILALVAKSKLINDTSVLDTIPLPSSNKWQGQLKDYIPEEWIKSKREVLTSVCSHKHFYDANKPSGYRTETPNDIIFVAEDGTSVKKGDAILKYNFMAKDESKTRRSGIYGWSTYKDELIEKTETIVAPYDCAAFTVITFEKGKTKKQDDQYWTVVLASIFDDLNSVRDWYNSQHKEEVN